jgi:inosine-uridine nucleoside N-ribohydrolase
MKQLIIDTDPGVDDALAIAFAISSALPVTGITTVYGNTSVENCSRNALTILEIMKSSIPVFTGAARPILGKPVLPQSHGDNGLGGFSLPELKRIPEDLSALEFMIRTLEKGKTTIVCMGPSTNLSILVSLRPDLVKNIEELIILSGVFFEKGNMTPVAEFNVLNDPYSLKNILTLQCKKTIIPINVCRKVIFTKKDFEKIVNKKLRNTFKKITDLFIKYYTSDDEYAGFSGAVMYDLLTISYLLNTKLFTLDKGKVDVEISSPLTFAQTIFAPDNESNCNVAMDINAEKVKELFFETINSAEVK